MTTQQVMIDIRSGVQIWLQGSPAIIRGAPGPGCDSEPWSAIVLSYDASSRSAWPVWC